MFSTIGQKVAWLNTEAKRRYLNHAVSERESSPTRGFIYVARQVARAFFSFFWKASSRSHTRRPSQTAFQQTLLNAELGGFAEKLSGGRMSCSFASQVFGGARSRVGKVWGWISAFTGCPHLFAEGARPRVDTRMECCLHANEHCDDKRRVPEASSQTTPSGNTV